MSEGVIRVGGGSLTMSKPGHAHGPRTVRESKLALQTASFGGGAETASSEIAASAMREFWTRGENSGHPFPCPAVVRTVEFLGTPMAEIRDTQKMDGKFGTSREIRDTQKIDSLTGAGVARCGFRIRLQNSDRWVRGSPRRYFRPWVSLRLPTLRRPPCSLRRRLTAFSWLGAMEFVARATPSDAPNGIPIFHPRT